MSTTAISSVQSSNLYALHQSSSKATTTRTSDKATSTLKDKLDLGQSAPLSKEQTNAIILDRAYNKLRSVVDGARAELGLPEGSTLDISAEATAQRIGDFALNFFDKYLEKHPEVSGEAARKQFADFIGAAIGQGIEEASGILESLSALDPDVTTKIDSIGQLIQKRLDDFVAGK